MLITFSQNSRAISVKRAAAVIGLILSTTVLTAQAQTSWLFAGADIQNSRSMLSPAGTRQLNATTVSKLAVKWIFTAKAPIRATPTVEPGGLYVTDEFGTVYKINPDTGALIWSNPSSVYSGSTSQGGSYGHTRSSPAIGALGEIVLGDITTPVVYAVNRTTGALIWKTFVDDNPNAFFHGSPVIYNGIVYIGLSSREEGLIKLESTFVPTFRGSVVALDEKTGKFLWKFGTAPPGYTGAAVWSAQPVVFAAANALIFGTGNNYTVPDSVSACVLKAGSSKAIQAQQGVKCLDPADQVDAIVSVDLTTGAFNWSRKLQGPDTYNGACESGLSSCPDPEGFDFDFAAAPNLVKLSNFTGVADDRGGLSKSYLLGAGQKSGVYWALNPYTGGLFWATLVAHGVIQWGPATATDTNEQAFVGIDNSDSHFGNLLISSTGVSQYWNAGSWGSIDLKTGKMNWQVRAIGGDIDNPDYGSNAPGAISYSNGVMFAASSSGYMAALDAATGNLLWQYNTSAYLESAPAIYNDTVYWGSGQPNPAAGQLFAFSIGTATAAAKPSP